MKWMSVVVAALFVLAAPVSAVVIDGGPDYSPPGAGSVVVSGSADVAGGRTLTYTGIDLAQTSFLYYGPKVDAHINGWSSDGGGITGLEVFRYASRTANTIVYTGQTILVIDPGSPGGATPGVVPTATRITYTFTGTGATNECPVTIALNDPTNGDVHALFEIQSSNVTVHQLIEAQVPPGDANAGNFEPARDLFNRLFTQHGTQSSVDSGYYYLSLTANVPAVSEWGLLIMGAVLVIGVGVLIQRRVLGVVAA